MSQRKRISVKINELVSSTSFATRKMLEHIKVEYICKEGVFFPVTVGSIVSLKANA